MNKPENKSKEEMEKEEATQEFENSEQHFIKHFKSDMNNLLFEHFPPNATIKELDDIANKVVCEVADLYTKKRCQL